MPVSIQRVVFPRAREAAFEADTVPDPGRHGVLVRTVCTAVSAGTETTALLGGKLGDVQFPLRPGYSHVGTVEAVGEAVEGYRVGDRVLSMGGHQSHVLLDLSPTGGEGAYLEHLPSGLAADHAAFAILGSVALHGIRRAELQVGMGVAIFGQGMVGQLLVQLARWSGCGPIIAVDLEPERLEMARHSGADVVVHAGREDVAAAVARATAGRGVEAVFDATRTPRTLPAMMTVAARGGKVLIVGSSPGTVEIETFHDLQRKELSIVGCWQPMAPLTEHHRLPWTQRRNRQAILQLMVEGRLRLDHLITHRVHYTQAPQVFAMMEQGPTGWLGVVLEWETAPPA